MSASSTETSSTPLEAAISVWMGPYRSVGDCLGRVDLERPLDRVGHREAAVPIPTIGVGPTLGGWGLWTRQGTRTLRARGGCRPPLGARVPRSAGSLPGHSSLGRTEAVGPRPASTSKSNIEARPLDDPLDGREIMKIRRQARRAIHEDPSFLVREEQTRTDTVS